MVEGYGLDWKRVPRRLHLQLASEAGALICCPGQMRPRMLAERASYMFTATTKAARKLGTAGPEVFPIALGCMGMSGVYGASDDGESVATIHAAIDAGVNL